MRSLDVDVVYDEVMQAKNEKLKIVDNKFMKIIEDNPKLKVTVIDVFFNYLQYVGDYSESEKEIIKVMLSTRYGIEFPDSLLKELTELGKEYYEIRGIMNGF